MIGEISGKSLQVASQVPNKKTLNSNHLPLRIFFAVGTGILLGVILGPRANLLGEVGMLLVQVLKTLATPLIFFAILDAFSRAEIRLKSGKRLLVISAMNAAVASVIALGITILFPIGRYFSTHPVKDILPDATPIAPLRFDLIHSLQTAVPPNILEPFLGNHVITLVTSAVLIGAVLRSIQLKGSEEHESRESHESIESIETLTSFFRGAFLVLSTLLGWVVQTVPFAVFCVVAKWVGEKGLGIFQVLGLFVILVFLGMVVHVGFYYSFLIGRVARKSPRLFFRDASEALATAFGTGSSLATLPVTLKTLQDKMKISPESSRLAACIGTNLNHDGILLYEAVAALFIAQAHGIQLDFGDRLSVILTSTLAAVGIAGVPDAGLITLSLVLNSVGLPLTWVPLLMTVDWLVGRMRATANVASDLVVATLLEKAKIAEVDSRDSRSPLG